MDGKSSVKFLEKQLNSEWKLPPSKKEKIPYVLKNLVKSESGKDGVKWVAFHLELFHQSLCSASIMERFEYKALVHESWELQAPNTASLLWPETIAAYTTTPFTDAQIKTFEWRASYELWLNTAHPVRRRKKCGWTCHCFYFDGKNKF